VVTDINSSEGKHTMLNKIGTKYLAFFLFLNIAIRFALDSPNLRLFVMLRRFMIARFCTYDLDLHFGSFLCQAIQLLSWYRP